jgi:hypothetical protein
MPAQQLHGLLIMVTAFGGLLVIIGIVVAVKTRRPFAGTLRTTGTVVDLDEEDDGDGITYAPVVRFVSGEKEFTFVDPMRSYPTVYRTGDTVAVRYLPADPGRARVASWKSHLLTIVIVSIGALVLAGGLWGLGREG